MADLTDTIEDAAKAPRKMQGDQATIEEHPLLDLIAADKYLAGKTAAERRNLGLRFRQLVPPGAD